MAVDVTATDSTQLLDWSNSLFYPTTTDGNTGGGGIDLAAINGNSFAVVPEPVSNAILFSFVLLVSFRHWKQQRRTCS
jgi:hypothetical protein